MEQELRTIIQEAWCAGGNVPVKVDTFGAFFDRAAKAIMEAGYRQLPATTATTIFSRSLNQKRDEWTTACNDTNRRMR